MMSWHFWRYTRSLWHRDIAARVKCVCEEQPFVVVLQGQEPGEQCGAVDLKGMWVSVPMSDGGDESEGEHWHKMSI